MDYTLLANITESGEIEIINKLEFQEFLRKNPNKRLVGHFSAFNGKSIEGQRKLFRGVFLPKLRDAFYSLGNRMSIDEIELFLTNEYYKPFDDLHDLSSNEMHDFLEWVKQFAAENLDLYNLKS